MTGYKRVNYYELCRLCTSSQQKDKIHIFREEGKKMQLQQKIQSCFPLLVCEHDYLPKVVCTSCIQTLDQCYSFRQACINSEAMLSSYFTNFRFTDDFKKAGKVYVKDTGQKTEPIRNENINLNVERKNVTQEQSCNLISPTQPNLIRDQNRPYFNPELPILPKTIPKTSPLKNEIKPNYTQINTAITNTNLTKENQNLLKITTNTNNQTNLITCNIASINFNGNINPKSYDNTKGNNNIENINEFSNVLKTSIASNQAMMLIDMEQLIETGLPESEVNKLKEALMKPKNQKDKDEFLIGTPSVDNIKPEYTTIEGVKIFKCEICDRLFKRREHLYQHSKLHSGVRPFSCVHCPKTFSRKEHLMRHLTSHSGIKEYSCDVCNKRFSRPDNLKKHKKTHDKSPYRCEICTKTFVVKHYYLAHMQGHQNGENMINNMMKVENNDM